MALRESIALRAAVLGLGILGTPVLADDPKDPTMQTPEAIARDRAIIRQMNKDMLAQVRKRDAGYAQGWRDYRNAPRAQAEYERRLADYERQNSRYANDRKRYEQAMADWRRDVRACRAGYYAACD